MHWLVRIVFDPRGRLWYKKRTRRRLAGRRRVLTKPTRMRCQMANSRLCSIPGCEKPHKGRGYCQGHLVRLRLTGSVRADVPLKDMGKTERSIVEASRVPYTAECIPWPHAKDPAGRGIGTYKGRTMLASRAVCMEAHGEPPSKRHEAAHSCGNGHLGCVNPYHLRWATRKENEADKLAHGTRLHGEMMPNHVLSDTDCEKIRSLRGKISQRKLAKIYGVSQQHISAVQTGKFRTSETNHLARRPQMV